MRSFEKKPAILLPLVISFTQYFMNESELKLLRFLNETIYASLKFCHLSKINFLQQKNKTKDLLGIAGDLGISRDEATKHFYDY